MLLLKRPSQNIVTYNYEHLLPQFYWLGIEVGNGSYLYRTILAELAQAAISAGSWAALYAQWSPRTLLMAVGIDSHPRGLLVH